MDTKLVVIEMQVLSADKHGKDNAMKDSRLKTLLSADDASDAQEQRTISSTERRDFLLHSGSLIASAAAGSLLPGIASAQSPAPLFAYVGCYTTTQRKGTGKGIGVFSVNPVTAQWAPVQLVDNVINPSFLCLDREQNFLYAAHGDLDYVSAYAIDPASGKLSKLSHELCGGINPVHVAVDASNKYLVVSNYTSGNVAVLPINPDGTLAPISDLVNLAGTPGPHRTQQAGSHPHHNPFDSNGRFIVVPDKGLDRIFIYRLDDKKGKLIAADIPSIATRDGAGPRHVDFNLRLPYMYAINELDSSITTYRYDRARGELTPLQILPTIPSDFTGNNTAAEVWVHPSGRFVYGSNRGHDSIAIYFVDRGTGLLATVGWQLTQGRTPRFFGLDPSGTLLCAANQISDTIVNFRVDQSAGKLQQIGDPVAFGSPVTIVFRQTETA